jgi:DNA-binding transcriptional MerR regulator
VYDPPPDGFVYADDACRLTGVSYRQLDHWCTLGVFGRILRGEGKGRPRLFSETDLARVAAARRMRDLGIPLDRIRDELRQDRELVLVHQPVPYGVPELPRARAGRPRPFVQKQRETAALPPGSRLDDREQAILEELLR